MRLTSCADVLLHKFTYSGDPAVMSAVLLLVLLVTSVQGDALGALEALLPSYLLDNVEDLVRAASAACMFFFTLCAENKSYLEKYAVFYKVVK